MTTVVGIFDRSNEIARGDLGRARRQQILVRALLARPLDGDRVYDRATVSSARGRDDLRVVDSSWRFRLYGRPFRLPNAQVDGAIVLRAQRRHMLVERAMSRLERALAGRRRRR